MRTFPRSSLGSRIRVLRQAKSLSQVDLARMIGRHQTVIGPYERDEYEPPREVVEKLAHVLEATPEYLYFGRHPRRSALAVAGVIGAMGLLDADTEPTVAAMAMREGELLGFEVRDDSMAPVFRPGQVVLVAARPSPPAGLLGRDALVELGDGRRLLRRLAPAAEAARYDLAAYNAPTLPAVVVEGASLVSGVLWPEACVGLGTGDTG